MAIFNDVGWNRMGVRTVHTMFGCGLTRRNLGTNNFNVATTSLACEPTKILFNAIPQSRNKKMAGLEVRGSDGPAKKL